MLGWTLLLVWAYQKPLERRFVAALTIFVILGLVLTEILGLFAGNLSPGRVVPVLCLQAGLLTIFAAGCHDPTVAACTDLAPDPPGQ
jgi:hypothetical protein